MNNVYFTAEVSEDGTITIPSFAVRGLGYIPGETVRLAIPPDQTICDGDCAGNELFITQCCTENLCDGYRIDSNTVLLPARVFVQADVPVGTDFHLFAGDNTILLVAGVGDSTNLHDEVSGLLDELGIQPGPPISVGSIF